MVWQKDMELLGSFVKFENYSIDPNKYHYTNFTHITKVKDVIVVAFIGCNKHSINLGSQYFRKEVIFFTGWHEKCQKKSRFHFSA